MLLSFSYWYFETKLFSHPPSRPPPHPCDSHHKVQYECTLGNQNVMFFQNTMPM